MNQELILKCQHAAGSAGSLSARFKYLYGLQGVVPCECDMQVLNWSHETRIEILESNPEIPVNPTTFFIKNEEEEFLALLLTCLILKVISHKLTLYNRVTDTFFHYIFVCLVFQVINK